MDRISGSEVNSSGLLNSEYIYETFLVQNYTVIYMYIPVIVTALTANVLVIIVVVNYNFMRSVTNYFLVNLSVADLLVTLVCMPNAMWNAYSNLWMFGHISCKVANYLQCICVASSVFTITAMALDRYLAITRPFGLFSRCFDRKTTLFVIAAVWTFALLLFVPVFSVIELHTEVIPLPARDRNLTVSVTIQFCREQWNDGVVPRHVFGIICFVTMFALPGMLILSAYSMMGKKLCSMTPPFDVDEGISSSQQGRRLVRERRRAAAVLLLLALVFFVCWLPYNTIILLMDTRIALTTDVLPYVLILGHFNSALNPIIYCAMSRNFRLSLKHLAGRLLRSFVRTRQPTDLQWPDSSKSSQRNDCVQQLRCVSLANKNTNRFQTSQKTTKTCAV